MGKIFVYGENRGQTTVIFQDLVIYRLHSIKYFGKGQYDSSPVISAPPKKAIEAGNMLFTTLKLKLLRRK
ncbi:hypothetical protein AO263_21830 [Pseudomonas sp. NZIPFR-PS5]|jgi:hypothetical protein|nr:hypothetical protein AO263_21830 [Pseudomonas sp. NZIPFR-PS5]